VFAADHVDRVTSSRKLGEETTFTIQAEDVGSESAPIQPFEQHQELSFGAPDFRTGDYIGNIDLCGHSRLSIMSARSPRATVWKAARISSTEVSANPPPVMTSWVNLASPSRSRANPAGMKTRSGLK